MGYYTYYSLAIENKNVPKNVLAEIDAEIKTMNVLDGSFCRYGFCSGEDKWYYHDEDMLLLSTKFPEVLFCLDGTGEDSEDIWRTYYQNGKMQHCPASIVYDDYNPEKMQPGIIGTTKYSYQMEEDDPI